MPDGSFSPEQICAATGCESAAVTEFWPRITAALAEANIGGQAVEVGVAATVVVETAHTFAPIHEFGTPADWADYEGGPDYAGRGFIQLTHRSNYAAAGEALGMGSALVDNPDLALDPQLAARILAWYWSTHGVPSRDRTRWYSLVDLCNEGDWRWVRRVVNGGENGMAHFLDAVVALQKDRPLPAMMFDPDYPQIPQPGGWQCAIVSLWWCLRSLGRATDLGWLIDAMSNVWRIDTPDVGLHDATGGQLQGFVDAEYGEFGIEATNAHHVSFDEVAAVAGTKPLMIGGWNWNHWSGVRRYDPSNDILELANPASGHMGIHQTMTRGEFENLGWFAMAWLDAPELTTGQHEHGGDDMVDIAPFVGAIAYLGDDVADKIEQTRATIDDFGDPPPPPPPNAKKAELEAYAKQMQQWAAAVRANTDRVYKELGDEGGELRRVREEFVGPRPT